MKKFLPSMLMRENKSYERTTYINGDIATADLLDRIDQLTKALGRALAELEDIKQDH